MLPSLFLAVIGACGGNFTKDVAVIYSPDFPDSYGSGKACYWTIQVPGASLIQFNFPFFDIKDSRDMVELLDGYTKQVLVRYDGRNHPINSFNISSDFVILYFFSDRVNQAQGFAIVYQGKRAINTLLLYYIIIHFYYYENSFIRLSLIYLTGLLYCILNVLCQ